MALITDPVQVCNLGLSLLKVDPITSIEEPGTDTEAICSLWYDTTRRQVLRAHPWNFAKKRVTLSRNATAPNSGYPDRYALPNDYLRLIFIDDEEEPLTQIDYEIENGYLLIDNAGAADLDIGYIFDEVNVNAWDELFKRYVAVQMAYNMAYGFSGKTTLVATVKDMLQEVRNEARAINGQDTPPKRVTMSKVLGARRRYSSGGGFVSDPTIVPGI
jgi:hypothetical protein